MLQKNYWLGCIQDKQIKTDRQDFTLFCTHLFPSQPFSNTAFIMFGGEKVSNTNTWKLVINNRSIYTGIGSVKSSAFEAREQIRLFMILRINLFFGHSSQSTEKLCNAKNISVIQALPDFFRDESISLQEEIEALDSWFKKALSLPRIKYLAVCQALTTYERAIHILSIDPTLAYSLLVFAIESLANSDPDYQATWNDVSKVTKEDLEKLFKDERISPIDDSWIEEFRKILVDIVHPKATKRFVKFAQDHILSDLYDASNSVCKSPLKCSRIRQNIENAYDLRSRYSHSLESLPEFIYQESYRSEEVEGYVVNKEGRKIKTSFLTLRGLFRVVRSIILNFIEKQPEDMDMCSYPWINEQQCLTQLAPITTRVPAYLRIKDADYQFHAIKAEDSQDWFEDILTIYQDNYIERLHEKTSEGQAEDSFLGIATSGNMRGRAITRFDISQSSV